MKNQQGFTLIELAIVLVIVTLLVGGLAMPLSAQIQARRIAETNKTLEEAQEAIIGYAMSHSTLSATCLCNYNINGEPTGTNCPQPSACPTSLSTPPFSVGPVATLTIPTRHYLPCPDKFDDNNPATMNDGDGIEEIRVSGACPEPEGYLPWVTLGTAAQDAWGNRFRYRVTADFSDDSKGIPKTGGGDLQICDTSANAGVSDCGASGNVAAKVPVVLLSHGPNGWGARNINNTTLRLPTSNNEKENSNTDHIDKEFVSRSPSKPGDTAGEFDDLVRWISADQLRGRVCPAGGCP